MEEKHELEPDDVSDVELRWFAIASFAVPAIVGIFWILQALGLVPFLQ